MEEYEYEDIFTREQIAEFLETIAEQIRKGYKLTIPMPIRKDGEIVVSVSELLNMEISVRKTKSRTNISLSIWSKPTEIYEEKEKEEKGEE